MSKHRKAQGRKSAGDKKQKANGKKEEKDRTVAAELGEAVMREEPPKPVAAPVARPERAAPAKEPVKPKAQEPPPVVKREAPEPAAIAVKAEMPDQPGRLLETAVDAFERTFKAAGQGTIEVNRKLLDFTRANVSSGFDFAMSLASASNPVEIMQLQMNYWDERMKVLASQAEELRALSADLVAKANEPIREHIRRAQLA
jgi:hypothetical protein